MPCDPGAALHVDALGSWLLARKRSGTGPAADASDHLGQLSKGLWTESRSENRGSAHRAEDNTRFPPSRRDRPGNGRSDSRGALAHGGKGRSRRSRRGSDVPPLQVSTLVLRRLPVDCGTPEVASFLEAHGASPMDIEFHVDDSHNFRGTVFACFASPALARDAMEKLGPFPEYAGQKLRVELQRSNQKSEALMPAEHRGIVQILIECFLASVDHVECWLPASLSPQQRKYAHSLAEKHGLTHVTHSGQDDEKYVYLSKCKSRIPKRASSWSNPYGVSSGESTTIDSPEPQGSLSPGLDPLSHSAPSLATVS